MKKLKISKRARRLVSGGTVTLATVGLTTCTSDDGCGTGGVVDPAPPPPLTCKQADHGQNLHAQASLDSLSLAVTLYNGVDGYISDVDTVYVTDVTGAVLVSVVAEGRYSPIIELGFTLDSLTVTEVRFTVKGAWILKAGPCNFQRTFTCTIKPNGSVDVSQRERRLPLDVPRDVHIELVDRDGLRVNLRAAVAGEGTPEWRATAGKLERVGRLDVTWELPPDPGFYQIEFSVDRGIHGIGFDALALEVS